MLFPSDSLPAGVSNPRARLRTLIVVVLVAVLVPCAFANAGIAGVSAEADAAGAAPVLVFTIGNVPVIVSLELLGDLVGKLSDPMTWSEVKATFKKDKDD